MTVDHLLKRIQQFKETGDSRQIDQNEIDKSCIQYDISWYGGFKGFAMILDSDKTFCDKGFNFAKNPKYDVYQCRLSLMVCKCFDKNSVGSADKSPIKI